jgi:glycosyltransferase involved in cell wall biosynthesis
MPFDPHAPADVTVVMPAYNEELTIAESMVRVLEQPFVRELIVVDDGSKDSTREVVATIVDPRVRFAQHVRNLGKGAALRTGIAMATSDFVAIQDADLEYDPADLAGLLGPLRDGRADVVYGSRFAGSSEHRVLYYWHSVGNKFLTLVSNMATNINLTDMETCYKVFRREVIQRIEIEENGFGFEPEVTAKVAAMGCRIYEIGVSYSGRTYDEGKKIGWKDGVRAFYAIGKYSYKARRLYGNR